MYVPIPMAPNYCLELYFQEGVKTWRRYFLKVYTLGQMTGRTYGPHLFCFCFWNRLLVTAVSAYKQLDKIHVG